MLTQPPRVEAASICAWSRSGCCVSSHSYTCSCSTAWRSRRADAAQRVLAERRRRAAREEPLDGGELRAAVGRRRAPLVRGDVVEQPAERELEARRVAPVLGLVVGERGEHLEPAVGRRRLRLHDVDDCRHGLRRGHFVDRELQFGGAEDEVRGERVRHRSRCSLEKTAKFDARARDPRLTPCPRAWRCCR